MATNSTPTTTIPTWLRYTIAAIIVVTALIDVFTTMEFLEAGEQEGNPAAAFLFDSIGLWPTIALKAVVTVGAIWVIFKYPKYWWFAIAITLPLIFTAINNLM